MLPVIIEVVPQGLKGQEAIVRLATLSSLVGNATQNWPIVWKANFVEVECFHWDVKFGPSTRILNIEIHENLIYISMLHSIIYTYGNFSIISSSFLHQKACMIVGFVFDMDLKNYVKFSRFSVFKF